RVVAMHGAPPAYVEQRDREPVFRPAAGGSLGRVRTAKHAIQIPDITVEETYGGRVIAALAGARTLLSVPLLKDNEVIGAFNLYRQEVQPFTEKQIELVQN